MKRFMLTACLFSLMGLTACEEKTAYQKEVDVDDDKVKTKETTVTEQPDGDVTIEKKSTTKEYDDGEVQEKTTTQTETIPK